MRAEVKSSSFRVRAKGSESALTRWMAAKSRPPVVLMPATVSREVEAPAFR